MCVYIYIYIYIYISELLKTGRNGANLRRMTFCEPTVKRKDTKRGLSTVDQLPFAVYTI